MSFPRHSKRRPTSTGLPDDPRKKRNIDTELYTGDHDDSNEPGTICQHCKDMGLPGILFEVPSAWGLKAPEHQFIQMKSDQFVRLVGITDPVRLLESDCTMCKLLVHSLGHHELEVPHQISLYDATNAEYMHCKIPVLVLQKERGSSISSLRDDLINPLFSETISSLRNDLIVPLCSETEGILHPIHEFVDWNRARNMMDFCLQYHVSRCCESQLPTDDLQVIDCNTRQVVDHTPGTPYVTLSYTWGDRSLREHSNKDMPQTVSDAIEATIRLGYKYLWVDSLCIKQEASVIHTQLRQMDRVYQNSILTIIAAAGNHCHYGLPGVSRPRRTSPKIQIGSSVATSIPYMNRQDIVQSYWSSRAWTYQEGLFATRRLIFTERQLYFECQGYCCYESIANPISLLLDMHDSSKQTWHGRAIEKQIWTVEANRWGLFPHQRTGRESGEIMKILGDYSARSLTYETDALNGVLGVFALFQRIFGMAHLHGIPYLRNPTSALRTVDSNYSLAAAAFIDALHWRSTKPFPVLNRRKHFPSWSWTGWEGKIVWPGHSLKEFHECKQEQVELRYSIQIETVAGDLLDWISWREDLDRNKPIPLPDPTVISNFIHVSSYISEITCNMTSSSSQTPGSLRHRHFQLQTLSSVPILVVLEFLETAQLYTQETSSGLYALHPPWINDNRFLVIKNVGHHWERVGTAWASYSSSNVPFTPFTSKEIEKTWTTIRLG